MGLTKCLLECPLALGQALSCPCLHSSVSGGSHYDGTRALPVNRQHCRHSVSPS